MRADIRWAFVPSVAYHFEITTMTSVLLGLLPLSFVLGFLTWTMLMGAREQERADRWAEAWADEHHAAKAAKAPQKLH